MTVANLELSGSYGGDRIVGALRFDEQVNAGQEAWCPRVRHMARNAASAPSRSVECDDCALQSQAPADSCDGQSTESDIGPILPVTEVHGEGHSYMADQPADSGVIDGHGVIRGRDAA